MSKKSHSTVKCSHFFNLGILFGKQCNILLLFLLLFAPFFDSVSSEVWKIKEMCAQSAPVCARLPHFCPTFTMNCPSWKAVDLRAGNVLELDVRELNVSAVCQLCAWVSHFLTSYYILSSYSGGPLFITSIKLSQYNQFCCNPSSIAHEIRTSPTVWTGVLDEGWLKR